MIIIFKWKLDSFKISYYTEQLWTAVFDTQDLINLL